MADYLTHNPFTGKPYTAVKKYVAQFLGTHDGLANKTVVDLCCGDGVTAFIVQQLGGQVATYDLIPDSCQLEQKPAYADVQKPLPIADESVDVVILQEVIEHLPNQLFTLTEIFRILKPGGELFLTTPSRSSIQARLSYLAFESEHLRHTPAGAVDCVWGSNDKDEKYYGHLFLVGNQSLQALGRIAGFKSFQLHKNTVGKTSIIFLPLLYPFIYAASLRAFRRDTRNKAHDSAYVQEKRAQFKLNVSLTNLTAKYLFMSFYK